QKLGSTASADVALERGSRGLLFDIVKMEERETWTARFLRSDREIGQTDFDGTFLRGTLPITQVLGPAVTGVCTRQLRRQTHSKRGKRPPSQISNLRVGSWLSTNAGGRLNTCKSNAPQGEWQTGE